MRTARRRGGAAAYGAWRWLVPVALALVAVLVVAIGPTSRGEPAASCAGSIPADAEDLPNRVAGYRHHQLVNAAHILRVGEDLGMSCRDQTIAVMTAMGESSLVVVDHGDGVGPDSRGLFQQRANGAWGSYADRMDPVTSATNFCRALKKIDGRDALEPTIVAHRVQRNADPDHYRKYWAPAQEVVAAITGAPTAT